MKDLWQRFLATRNARFDEQALAIFPVPPADSNARLADLGHMGLIAVQGPDATSFLQGQLTNDVAALEPGAWQWSGYCNAKGRLLGTLRLVRTGDGFLAETPLSIAADLVDRLRKFVLRAKVSFATRADATSGIGLGGPEMNKILTDWLGHPPPTAGHAESLEGGILIGARPDRWHLYLDTDRAIAAWERLSTRATPITTRAWARLDLDDGIPWIVPETQALFVPQMVDFELLGGVSFTKGCYPGQEIVARSQYLGAVKRRLHLARTTMEIEPGAPLASPALPGQTVGNVVSSAPAADASFHTLAVIDVESAAGAIAQSSGGAPLEDLKRVHTPP